MTPELHEAWFYERQADGRVHCTLCPHDCRIAKGSRDACSVRCNEHGVLPILDAIRLYHALGVWVDVTTLVIPGINDSDEELRHIAEFIRSVGPEVPGL
jgi:hypothetical protein